MMIRVGVEGSRRAVMAKVRELKAPILVSANSLFDAKKIRFIGWQRYAEFDVALDSGGFEAMRRYGGYRWTVEQYLELAQAMHPSWYAQMDFCCEPEIANTSKEVFRRIDMTVTHLHDCQHLADQKGIPRPMPVLQGWHPSDYCQGPIYDKDFVWPAIVGVGSVCRREIFGPSGIIEVVRALDRVIPEHVRLHLFGVKSQAIEELLKRFPRRVQSIDSMAWSKRARYHAFANKIPCDGTMKADFLHEWYARQIKRVTKPKQMEIF